ncbi:hypothetical protein V501_00676 [Pseudogymnoascus sp. VKM F-4519 (FW-2642)]|nr:hypothetical protein V501_00676 [Pseudogymnoascus sp. VKM F-4519 (FW-2642)]
MRAPETVQILNQYHKAGFLPLEYSIYAAVSPKGTSRTGRGWPEVARALDYPEDKTDRSIDLGPTFDSIGSISPSHAVEL